MRRKSGSKEPLAKVPFEHTHPVRHTPAEERHKKLNPEVGPQSVAIYHGGDIANRSPLKSQDLSIAQWKLGESVGSGRWRGAPSKHRYNLG